MFSSTLATYASLDATWELYVSNTLFLMTRHLYMWWLACKDLIVQDPYALHCTTAPLHYSTTLAALLHHCTTVSLHCTTVPLQHCITASLHHCTTALLHHCVTAPLRYCTTALLHNDTALHCTTALHYYTTSPLYHCTTASLHHCTTALHYCTTVPLHHCITAPLHHCTTVHLLLLCTSALLQLYSAPEHMTWSDMKWYIYDMTDQSSTGAAWAAAVWVGA
jgi:hypothetical protein